MMRRCLLAVVVALSALASVPAHADDFIYARFGDYIEALRVQIGIPGVEAAVIGSTDILWENGFGYQDLGRALPMRPDTPIHLDGLTQMFTAAAVLRCADEGRLSLDEQIGLYVPDAPEPGATFRELLSHTTRTGTSLTFNYRPERLDPLASVIGRCESAWYPSSQGASYRSTMAHLLDQLAMVNSVPGPDVLSFVGPADPAEPDSEASHYAAVLERLATPYSVDSQRRPFFGQYLATTLKPSGGLISTVHDYAQFDLALRSGLIVKPDTLAEAWRPPVDPSGKPLPHGLGWFVQGYNGELVAWQFGTSGDSGSSSMVITLPARNLTFVMLANSPGLVKSFPLSKGDVTTSPFARIFLSLFTR
jgi:CubicO group peptidase (beta-lactamase class C family)